VVARACGEAEGWVGALPVADAEAAVVFGTGPAWAGALEGALLLKEVAAVPAEGVETREGATSAMYPLRAGHLVASLPTGPDPLIEEAEAVCGAKGATVVRVPGGSLADRRLAAITTFPALVGLAAVLGVGRGLDVDAPAWTEAYYAVARGTA
jgi:glucosamine 6-phosphate synthetase-like amidotransferase/phosphosugar isomerase protein